MGQRTGAQTLPAPTDGLEHARTDTVLTGFGAAGARTGLIVMGLTLL